jgi:hypothetical protein
VCECADGILGELDDLAGVTRILLDGGCAVQNRAVYQDTHLVASEIEEYLESVYGP